MTFRVLQSNHIETLAGQLAARRAATPRAQVLRNDVVVVPNPGLGLWLRQFFAERDGVAAALDMPLPAVFVWRVLRWLNVELPAESPYRKEVLLWRAWAWLGANTPPAFEKYLAQPGAANADADATAVTGLPEQRRFDVARQIADVFDRYLVYRPQLLTLWEAGGLQQAGADARAAERWQAQLWRQMVADTGTPHAAARVLTALHSLDVPAGSLSQSWPLQHVAVFGVASLPPLTLQFYAALGQHIDVDMYVLNPSREYWSDIVTERVFQRAQLADDGVADYYQTGNPLLASMGRLGREFVDMVIELATDLPAGELAEAFVEPPGERLLARVQRELLHLTVRGSRERLTPERLADNNDRIVVAREDVSIRVHACASIVREIEVLHDQLLAAFTADPTLTPRDVIVMVPDIHVTAPVVEAVFGSRQGDMAIPYVIADRAPRIEDTVADVFRALLALPDSRLTRTTVLSLLAAPPVARRLGLDADALALLGHWLEDAHVHWGLDAEHWRALDMQPQQPPASGQGTWAYGIDRLLAGYALESTQPFEDLIGIAGVDGQAGEHAGVVAEFVGELAQLAAQLRQPVTAADWSARLTAMVLELLDADGPDAVAVKLLCDSIGALVEDAELAGLQEVLPLAVVRAWFERELDASYTGQGFPSGAVTFATLTPMRAIPFRVVALVGMNDADFPRIERPVGFDLMASEPRKGDRSRRSEDRYLFIEALLSVRDVLHVSYTGLEQRDASPKVPSVVVGELLDYLASVCVLAGDQPQPAAQVMAAVRDHLVVQHPLQPFSARYGDGRDARLFTYVDPALSVQPQAPAPVLREAGGAGLRLEDVLLFMRAPARAWFDAALRTNLYVNAAHWEDDEQFALQGLARWQLRDAALEQLGYIDPDNWERDVLLGGELPHGVRGAAAVAEVRAQMLQMRARLDALAGGPLDTRALEIHLGHQQVVVGNVDNIGPDGRVVGRVGQVKGTDLARLWTLHVALAAADMPMPSWLLDDDCQYCLPPLSPAVARTRLTEIVSRVLDNRQTPLPLLCNAGVWQVVDYARHRKLEAAVADDFRDEHTQRIWGAPAVPPGMDQLVEELYGPLADLLQEVK